MALTQDEKTPPDHQDKTDFLLIILENNHQGTGSGQAGLSCALKYKIRFRANVANVGKVDDDDRKYQDNKAFNNISHIKYPQEKRSENPG